MPDSETVNSHESVVGVKTVSEPRVSFVIPVLNSESDIARCLLSIRNLEYRKEDYEILIMDNGSIDRTPQVIRELGFDFQVVPRVNVSSLRNLGVAMARGDYIAFVDADIELTPDWLVNGLQAFEEHQVVASGCFPGVPTEATWVQQNWDIHQRGRQHEKTPKSVPWLPSMNLIVRRKEFLAVGGFNEHLETAEDVDLCYRLQQLGTILCNPAMAAIHWGEAGDLQTFWRKEVWRGLGNLKGLLSHGLRPDEVPSLGYPLYILCCVLFLALSIFLDIRHREIFLAPLSLGLLGLPACLLALNTARLARRPAAAPQLFLLYFVYGMARAFSVVKALTPLRG